VSCTCWTTVTEGSSTVDLPSIVPRIVNLHSTSVTRSVVFVF